MAHPHDGATGATSTHPHFGTSGTILIQFETEQSGSKMAQFHTESPESFLAHMCIESTGAMFAQAHFGAPGAEIALHTLGHTYRYLLRSAIATSEIPCASAALEYGLAGTLQTRVGQRGAIRSPGTEPPWHKDQGDEKKQLSCDATY
jgi:hypothetical protein